MKSKSAVNRDEKFQGKTKHEYLPGESFCNFNLSFIMMFVIQAIYGIVFSSMVNQCRWFFLKTTMFMRH